MSATPVRSGLIALPQLPRKSFHLSGKPCSNAVGGYLQNVLDIVKPSGRQIVIVRHPMLELNIHPLHQVLNCKPDLLTRISDLIVVPCPTGQASGPDFHGL
jgi:hypothetical protein